MLTLHRYGWRVEDALELYVVSCYHERRCPPAQEFRLPSIPGQQRDTLDHKRVSLIMYRSH